jgi:hypothetical protein
MPEIMRKPRELDDININWIDFKIRVSDVNSPSNSFRKLGNFHRMGQSVSKEICFSSAKYLSLSLKAPKTRGVNQSITITLIGGTRKLRLSQSVLFRDIVSPGIVSFAVQRRDWHLLVAWICDSEVMCYLAGFATALTCVFFCSAGLDSLTDFLYEESLLEVASSYAQSTLIRLSFSKSRFFTFPPPI